MSTGQSSGLSSAQRRALADILRSQPSATLGELGSILQGQLGCMLESLTIGDLLGRTAAGSRRSAAGTRRSASGSRRFDSGSRSPRLVSHDSDQPISAVNSRTAAGRRRYDAAVLSALRSAGRPLSAGELRLMVGGTGQQIRVSLKRLVEEDGVERTGIARGTRYHV